MDNLTDLPEVVRHARNTWRLICGHTVDVEEQRAGMLYALGDHPGNISDRLGPLFFALDPGFYTSQPAVPALVEKWRSRFELAENLSEADAQNFLVEVAGALELMEQLFAGHSLSGVTCMAEGEPNDVEVKRPAGKLSGWSLNLSTSGEGYYNCVRQQILTGPGDLVLLSPDAMYDYHRASKASHWTHSWIYFQPSPHLLEWVNWPEVGPHIYHLEVPESEYPLIKALFDSTLQFDPTKGRYSEALLLNTLEHILIRCSKYSAAEGCGMTDFRVKNAMDYIASNLDRALGVEDIARHVQLSKTQLSSLFKEHTGSTLIRWREERRVAMASRLLTQTSLQIQEIAEQVGYTDPLYFSRTFTRLVGCSPRSYRKDRQPIME